MTEGVERHIEVVRRARYWVLGEEVAAPAEVWFVLHGYAQLARRFLRRFQPLDDGTRRILAPEALNRFYASSEPGRHGPTSVVGATWMTREDRLTEIDDYVGYLDRLAEQTLASVAGSPRVTVLGFSQGVATASRWCVQGRMRPHRLVLWGDFLPPDLDLPGAREAWRDVDVVAVRGDGDRVVSSEKQKAAEEEALGAAGLTLRKIAYAGGHDIDPEVLRGVAGAQSSSSSPASDT